MISEKERNFLKGCFFTAAFLSLICCFTFQASADKETPFVSSTGRTYPRFGAPKDEATLAQGKKVYETYCTGCHGVQGDGKGPASRFLNPKPRNFMEADFRFRSTPSGDLPTDEDMYRTLTEGLKGSSMPSWRLLSETDRRAVITYLKLFAPEKWKEGHGPVTSVTDDPFGPSQIESAIKKGETAYHGMAMCYSCHAAYIPAAKINEARKSYGMGPVKAFRKDLGAPKTMTTSDGSVIVPPDFTWNRLKRGTDLQTLYHIVGNGISGTPMPTWKGVLPEEDLWGIVYYVQSLAARRKALVTDADIEDHYEKIAALDRDRVQFEAEMKSLDEVSAKKAAELKAKAAAPAPASPVSQEKAKEPTGV